MREADVKARVIGAQQRGLVTRQQLHAAGVSDESIYLRTSDETWATVQPGVFLIDTRPQGWEDLLHSAILAAGENACASHRAALVLWGLDGISRAPIELTVPYTHGPVPGEALVHRTRRPVESTLVKGIPVTGIERTLLDVCSVHRELIATKALESALRRRLTSVDNLHTFLKVKGGRGVRGTRLFRRILSHRVVDTATGSGSETEALFHMRRNGIPEPVLQQRFTTSIGSIRPDFFWPSMNKAVEVDGLDAHDSADNLDNDLRRQNALLELGIELRRYAARRIRREPDLVMAEISRFLAN